MPDTAIFLVGLFVFLLVGGGLIFTIHEFRSAESRFTKRD